MFNKQVFLFSINTLFSNQASDENTLNDQLKGWCFDSLPISSFSVKYFLHVLFKKEEILDNFIIMNQGQGKGSKGCHYMCKLRQHRTELRR